jgi:hypothetical protein
MPEAALVVTVNRRRLFLIDGAGVDGVVQRPQDILVHQFELFDRDQRPQNQPNDLVLNRQVLCEACGKRPEPVDAGTVDSTTNLRVLRRRRGYTIIPGTVGYLDWFFVLRTREQCFL